MGLKIYLVITLYIYIYIYIYQKQGIYFLTSYILISSKPWKTQVGVYLLICSVIILEVYLVYPTVFHYC